MGLAWRTLGLVLIALAAYAVAMVPVVCFFIASSRRRDAWDAWAEARLRDTAGFPEAANPIQTRTVRPER